MSDITGEVIKNSRELHNQFSQRKHSMVRVCGEEHSGSGTGEAQLWLTLDNDMAFISEMKFKLVFDTGVWSGSNDPTGSGSRTARWGTNLYPTIDSFLDAFPIGSYITYDNGLGAQCYNYALVFWNGQCNRALTTNDGSGYMSGYACDLYRLAYARGINQGTEFDLVTRWEDVRRGDWCVWCNTSIGHIAMAKSSPVGNTLECYGQNQQNGEPVIPVGKGFAINVAKMSSTGFQGAFRYKKWH